MDIIESQEPSLLAETLRKNGIACCSTEAIEKANQIIQVTEKIYSEDDKIQQLEQKYEFLLQQNNDRVSSEFNVLRNAMNSMISEINSLKNQLSIQQENISNQKPQETAEKVEVQQKIDDIKEEHPRQGNLTSDDVSIEKFFYFGQKEK